jgi:phospholipid-transporting ATPase
MSMVTCLLLYSAFTAWTGTALFDSFILTGFNTFYTFLPPIVFACLDMDVPAKAALAHPQLYIPGQKGR